MAGPNHPMTNPGLDAAARATVQSYLDALAARLTGPAPARRAILTELHDGLLEAVDAHLARGLPPRRAAAAAVAEFGNPPAIARTFAPELAGAHARRAALTLVPTGPGVGLLWVAAAAASHLGPTRPAPPWQWPNAAAGAWLAFPLLGVLIATGAVAALLVVATTSRLSRWLPTRPSLAPTAAATIGLALVTVDLTILTLVAVQPIVRPGSLAVAPVALAATASLTRLPFAWRTTRRCLATRAALP